MEDYSELFSDEDFVVEHLFASPENKQGVLHLFTYLMGEF